MFITSTSHLNRAYYIILVSCITNSRVRCTKYYISNKDSTNIISISFSRRLMSHLLVHGGWSTWGTCSATCGQGLQRRDRACDSPWPSKDGNHCSGDSVDNRLCTDFQCPGKIYYITVLLNMTIFSTAGSQG